MKIAFFCTGEGSFLKFIVLNLHFFNAEILLFVDRECGVYEALKDKIKCKKILREEVGDREFEVQALEWLKKEAVDYVILSCNRILRYDLLKSYGEEKRRMFNCHPSLLPKYVGFKAVERAYEANECFYGATIHYVTKEVDLGERVARCVVARKTESLKEFAHRLFVNQAVLLLDFCYRLSLRGGGQILIA